MSLWIISSWREISLFGNSGSLHWKARGIFGKLIEFRELFLYPCLSSMEGYEKWEWRGKLENQWKQTRGISSLIPTPHSSRFQLGMSLNPSWVCDMGHGMGSMGFVSSMGFMRFMRSLSSCSAKFQWQKLGWLKVCQIRDFPGKPLPSLPSVLLPAEIIGILDWDGILVH